MRVCGYDPLIAADSTMWAAAGIVRLDLQPLLARADVLSLHLPLTDGTRGLFDGATIGQMKKGAVLVNTSRGGIVDEAALVRALTSGHLGGAALDVFETEPLPGGSALAAAPNLLLTPHIAGLTVESNERVSTLIVERVLACLNLSPSNATTPTSTKAHT
jgi:(S)-sulfolactate dehydrogenase